MSLDRAVKRILARCVTDESSGCLVWQGSPTDVGYGTIRVDGRTRYTHRIMAESAYGPIPPKMQVDHLCRNRICCNPAHLEIVTQRTNLLRGMSISGVASRRNHCSAGHEYTPENTQYRSDGHGRICRTCGKERDRRRHERERAAR